MPIKVTMRQSVIDAKQQLAAGLDDCSTLHQESIGGVQLCSIQSDLIDSIVLNLAEAAISELHESGSENLLSKFALIPHGGYGRRELAPFSDVDLMILYDAQHHEAVEPFAARLIQDIIDTGLDLGHTVCSVTEACKLARQEVEVYTALAESRFLMGSISLFTKFARSFQHDSQRASRSLIAKIEEARRAERHQYGETVYLLQPNIKRSPGGLRALHYLRWVGFSRYGTVDLHEIQKLGGLSQQDELTLRQAVEYLLQMRNEMHFHAGKAADVLDRAEQVRLAEVYGYQKVKGLLPVEQFMRDFFQTTGAVRYIVANFVATARPKPRLSKLIGPMFSRKSGQDYLIGPSQISATAKGMEKLRRDPIEVIRLTELANQYDRRIAHSTWVAVQDAMQYLSDDMNQALRDRFLVLLQKPARLAEMLHHLLDLGLLEKIIPQFKHARGLLQFNAYHQYTVDQHSLKAVQCVTEFSNQTDILGEVYNQIQKKWVLHLALLLHDLGKGYPEDHSEVGLEIAKKVSKRFNLKESDSQTVCFLVHRHLAFSKIAFFRDVNDPKVVIQLAAEIGSAEILKMLFVLTCADLAAVGPDVLTQWKVGVLTDLYHRVNHYLTGTPTKGDVTKDHDEQVVAKKKQQILTAFHKFEEQDWLRQQIDCLPQNYLQSNNVETIRVDLTKLHARRPGEIKTWAIYLENRNAVVYNIAAGEGITKGAFHKITGCLSSNGMNILSAEIYTFSGDLILDRFYVQDTDYSESVPQSRMDDICKTIVETLNSDKPPKFRKLWQTTDVDQEQVIHPMPTRVKTDNSISEIATIFDIFTHDRMGLLYLISQTIYELGLSVHAAKIGTYLDQVVDVFYVTDQQGAKILDESRLQTIRQRLLEAIDEHEQ